MSTRKAFLLICVVHNSLLSVAFLGGRHISLDILLSLKVKELLCKKFSLRVFVITFKVKIMLVSLAIFSCAISWVGGA